MRQWLLRLLGLALFAVIILTTDVRQAFSILKSGIWLILAYLVASILLQFIIRTWKWDILLRAQGISLPFSYLLRMFFSSFLVTSTLPGRLGEFVRVLYVKRRGYSLGRSAVSVFVDRAQDIVFLLVMGFLGFLFFLSIVVYQVLVLIAAAGALIVLLTNRRVQRWLYSLFTGFLLPRQFRKGFASNFTDFMKDLRQLRPKTLVSTSLITVLSWLLHYTFLYLCAQAMGISLSLPYVVFIVSISTIVTTIPVSYLGIGTRDAVFLLLFEQAGLAAESAVAFSMVVLALYLIASVFGLAAWLYRP